MLVRIDGFVKGNQRGHFTEVKSDFKFTKESGRTGTTDPHKNRDGILKVVYF